MQEIEALERAEDDMDSMDAAMPDDMGRRGQILWIRGLTRLQHQVGGATAVAASFHLHSMLTLHQANWTHT